MASHPNDSRVPPGCATERDFRPRVAIGTMVYNESANLGTLLECLSEASPGNCDIVQILVVASGCTDGSDAVARAWATREPRIEVLLEDERRGKATAINHYLRSVASGTDICVLISADVIPAPNAIEELVAPFVDATVGMSGGHPCPTNPPDRLIHRVVHCLWDLHHLVASVRPKLGELVAFRSSISRINAETAVDEASLEASLSRAGLRLVYAGGAVVYNRGPGSVAQYLMQRRRIFAGHLWLRRKTGYLVSTMRPLILLRAAWEYLRRNPRNANLLLCAALLEGAGRLLGVFDLLVRGRNPTIWPTLDSTKTPAAPLHVDRHD